MMKSRREDFHDPFVQHPPETRQEPTLFKLWEKRGERLSACILGADARQARQRRVPDLNNETHVNGKNADWTI
jgi:hypothetical protein